MRPAARAIVGLLAATGVLLALVTGAAAAGAVSGPPGASWSSMAAWYEDVGPAGACMAALWALTLVVTASAALGCALQLVARASPRPAVRVLADRLTLPAVRRLVAGAAGLSVSVALAGPPALAGAAGDPPGTAVMEVLDAEEPARLPPPAQVASTPPAAGADPADTTVVVAPGDSFWRIAERWAGEAADGARVANCWRRLVDANLDRLVEPANPDLLYAGQVLVLPSEP
jgi:nucleoid-associated protein YgaU